MGTIKEEVIRVFTIGPTTTRRIWDYIYLERIIEAGLMQYYVFEVQFRNVLYHSIRQIMYFYHMDVVKIKCCKSFSKMEVKVHQFEMWNLLQNLKLN
jgi:hypothetical protein